MIGIAILLFAAAFAYGVSHRLQVPAIPILLVTGVVLPALLGVMVDGPISGALPMALLEDTLILGTTMLLFVTGMELTPRNTQSQRQVTVRVGALQFVLLGLVGLIAAAALGYGLVQSSYIALALTASSTLVVVRLLQQRRQLFEPFGRLVLGVLLLQDLFVLLLIPLLTDLPAGPLAALRGFAATIALLGISLLTYRYVAPWIERLDRDEEVLLLVLLAVLFVFVALASALGLPLVTGAFLAGLALSRFPLSSMARTHLGSITEFFSALFFIALGAVIGIPSGTELMHALLLVLVVVGVTPPLVMVIAERAGMSTRSALESGLLLAQTSEISLVIGLFGMIGGQIDEAVFTVIALVTLITMVMTPFITADRVAWWLMRHRPSRPGPARRRLDGFSPEGGHVLVLGSGSTGMPLLETLLSTGLPIVVIDDDPVVIERLRDAEVPCLRGDASNIDLLRRAGADRARIILSTVRRPQDNRRLLEFASGVPALIRVFDQEDADWIRELGGTPVLASYAAADETIRWFEEEFRPASRPRAAPIAPS